MRNPTVSVKLTQETRDMLRLTSYHTGETIQEITERLARAELERLEIKPATPGQKVERVKEVKHRKPRTKLDVVRTENGTPRLLATVPAKG